MIRQEIIFSIGDLVYYIGPPLLNPMKWDLIVEKNNGIIDDDEIGVIIRADQFLKIADVFFQDNELTINRISFKNLILAV